jgi:hypothetical protein
MLNMQLSVKIYDVLMNGRILNRQIIENDTWIANPLFIEIMDNLDDYRKQYEMSGYNFIASGDYVYIAENSSDDLKTDISMRAQVLLMLIGKFLNNNNFSLQKLNNLNAGLTFADIENIQKMEETSELLIRMGLKENDLLSSIKNILVERHILLEKINTQAYILSAIGQKFFDDLKNLYSIDTSD